MLKNVRDIQKSYKIHQESYGKMESRIGCKRKDPSKGENPRRIFREIAMIPLNYIRRTCHGGYKFTKSQEKINYYMCIDDIKLFARSEKELKTLIRTLWIYSEYTGMEFGIENSVMLIIKSEKKTSNERNRSAKSRKNPNSWKKGKLHVLGNTGSGHDQRIGDDKKKKKRKE